MEFLAKNLWHVFEVAREKNVDMTNADDVFIHAIHNPEQYKCMAGKNAEAMAAEWDSCDQAVAKHEYNMLVVGPMGNKTADQYKELCAAFKAGDKAAFAAAVKNGIAILEK